MEEMKENFVKRRRKSSGATRHCCYGLCNNDSRYADRENMKNVWWIPFPKPKRQQEKCQRWIRACGREDFTTENVRKWTYICSKHFVGAIGPTSKYPDPIPATFTPLQTEKFSRKRKAPTPRAQPVSKKQLFDASDALLSLQDVARHELSDVTDALLSLQNTDTRSTDMTPINDNPPPTQTSEVPPIPTQSTDFQSQDTGTQTNFVCNDALASKIDKIIEKNMKTSVVNTNRSKLLFEVLSKKHKLFKFYTGITVGNFNHLFDCLGETVNHLIYWKGNRTRQDNSMRVGRKRKLLPVDELLLTLVKLRHAFPNKDLGYRFGISPSYVSEIVNTWIQFLFKQTECVRKGMFPSHELIKENLPSQFKSFKNVRVIIDCFEIFVESSTDFEGQGNLYSSYKHHTTLKCLVGIAPTGTISFLSDTYEGSISDKEIVVRSGLVNVLNPNDLVIADRGFLIREELMQHGCHLNIPPFLGRRSKLTAQVEILTKKIARVRIHVERAIERIKNFKILSTKLPLSLKAVASQIVHVIGFLVNYQKTLSSNL